MYFTKYFDMLNLQLKTTKRKASTDTIKPFTELLVRGKILNIIEKVFLDKLV